MKHCDDCLQHGLLAEADTRAQPPRCRWHWKEFRSWQAGERGKPEDERAPDGTYQPNPRPVPRGLTWATTDSLTLLHNQAERIADDLRKIRGLLIHRDPDQRARAVRLVDSLITEQRRVVDAASDLLTDPPLLRGHISSPRERESVEARYYEIRPGRAPDHVERLRDAYTRVLSSRLPWTHGLTDDQAEQLVHDLSAAAVEVAMRVPGDDAALSLDTLLRTLRRLSQARGQADESARTTEHRRSHDS